MTFGFKPGQRVQRLGWHRKMQGTIKAVGENGGSMYAVVKWDFRGIEDDYTTSRLSDLIPADFAERLFDEAGDDPLK